MKRFEKVRKVLSARIFVLYFVLVVGRVGKKLCPIAKGFALFATRNKQQNYATV